MHLSSSQVCVIHFYLFNGMIYQSLVGVTYNILAPPRRFAMVQLHFRACSGLSLSSSLASHPQAPSGPFSVTQSYLTLCEPMNFSLPSPPVHVIFQARMLEWIAIFYSRESSQPRGWTHVSCIFCTSRWVLYHCTTREAYLVLYCSLHLIHWLQLYSLFGSLKFQSLWKEVTMLTYFIPDFIELPFWVFL